MNKVVKRGKEVYTHCWSFMGARDEKIIQTRSQWSLGDRVRESGTCLRHNTFPSDF